MCGIFAYAGGDNTAGKIINGLRRLEYRGYDSWGLALLTDSNGSLYRHRQVGAVADLIDEHKLAHARIGIGHTRWATHGGVSWDNAHPHLSAGGDFALVHNGIVENYQTLKQMLMHNGHRFISQTDSEVIVRLIEDKLRSIYQNGHLSAWQQPLRMAVSSAFGELQGFNTILLIAGGDDCLIGVRNGSPLVTGLAGEELYIASDPLAFADHTSQVSFVEDRQLIEYRNDRLTFYDIDSGERIIPASTELDFDDTSVFRGTHEHFMIKEILEQPAVIGQAAQLAESDLQALAAVIGRAARVITVGAGGAFYTAQHIAGFLQRLAGIDVRCIAAYEMVAEGRFIGNGDVIIAVSQSGETADTLHAVQLAKQRGAIIASIVNMPGASLSRLSDYTFYSNAGPEICVLSTKSSTAQMTFGFVLAHYLSPRQSSAAAELHALQTALRDYLLAPVIGQIEAIAQSLRHSRHLFILGKGAYGISARIGALNVKEASYIHAEAFAAGELKHGVIALIEEGVPVIVFSDADDRHAMLNTAAEVKSRGALVIGIADQPNELFDAYIPLPDATGDTAIIGSIVPCQLLAYFLSTLNGHNPDRPRNLAKSVTVR